MIRYRLRSGGKAAVRSAFLSPLADDEKSPPSADVTVAGIASFIPQVRISLASPTYAFLETSRPFLIGIDRK